VERDPASFRDPAGFVYWRDGVIYRQVDRSFADRWDDVAASGLLEELQGAGLLIRHESVDRMLAADPSVAHAVLRPERLAFISYPYEWSFSQLRDAAIVTLEAQRRAATHGFTLRDASAYNVQRHDGRDMLIDTLSFERAAPDAPWRPYRQFCQHFLAPLALMAHRDPRLGSLLRDFIDGIPLDLAASLLPSRTRWNLGLGPHLHSHARASRRDDGRPADGRVRLSPLKRQALIDSLRRTIEDLPWQPGETSWSSYADTTSYSSVAAVSKDAEVARMLEAAPGTVVWDLGANTGRFSRLATAGGRRVVAWDGDAVATDRHYRSVRAEGRTDTLPLVVDLTNPSPGLGWASAERSSFVDRSDADVVLALALVHHLAIGANVPLPAIADFLVSIAPRAVVEFVPRGDPMVERMLADREDVFADYTPDGFRAAFELRFRFLTSVTIEDSTRTLHLLERRSVA